VIKKIPRARPKGGSKAAIAVLLSLMLTHAILLPTPAWSRQHKLVKSKGYKNEDFRIGIITDYADMHKGDRID